MRIAVFGYYYQNNLGDEMFKIVYEQLFPSPKYSLSLYELYKINLVNLYDYDVVIIGSGDLINDSFGKKFHESLEHYNGYKIAMGVGVSFKDCLSRSYMRFFDEIYIRNCGDIGILGAHLGTKYVGYIPDLGFRLDMKTYFKNPTPKAPKFKVGFFLVDNLLNSANFITSITSFITYLLKDNCEVVLYPMYTGRVDDTDINDLDLHNIIETELCKSSVLQDYPYFTKSNRLTFESFIDNLRNIDMAFCVRFHSHIFATRCHTPFISCCLTRKDQLFMRDLQLPEVELTVDRSHSYNLIGFDVNEAIEKYHWIKDPVNYDYIVTRLQDFDDLQVGLWSQHRSIKSLAQKRKRYLEPPHHFTLADKMSNISNPTNNISEFSQKLCYNITLDPSNDYHYGTTENLTNGVDVKDIANWIIDDQRKIFFNTLARKANFHYFPPNNMQGVHRSGWNYVLESLQGYHSPYGIICDTYCDRTFGWGEKLYVEDGLLPYCKDWIGFFHHTFDEKYSDNNCSRVFKSSTFINSLYFCRAIIVLCQDLAEKFRKALSNIGYENVPVYCLTHPSEVCDNFFDLEQYLQLPCKKLVSVGGWYRHPLTIHELSYRKKSILKDMNIEVCTLKGYRMDSNFPKDTFHIQKVDDKYEPVLKTIFNNYLCDKISNNEELCNKCLQPVNTSDIFPYSAKILEKLSNEEYDNLLSTSILCLHLVDAAAVNTLIEAVMRHTPTIINKLPAVVEVFGDDYPLYYDFDTDTPKLEDLLTNDNIIKTHNYMKTINKKKYRLYNFLKGFEKILVDLNLDLRTVD